MQTGMDPSARPPLAPDPRLPRADGDGPGVARHDGGDRRAPPCRRGWTRLPGAPRGGHGGSPVQTGMDPRCSDTSGPMRRLPRADGDGPRRCTSWCATAWAPPCRRGWTVQSPARGRWWGGSPVQTGMDPTALMLLPSSTWLPRADGDGPPTLRRSRARRRAPPCRRGWTGTSRDRATRRGGSPVQTGMDPRSAPPPPASPRLPRADGDGPSPRARRTRPRSAPPCRRGWTRW